MNPECDFKVQCARCRRTLAIWREDRLELRRSDVDLTVEWSDTGIAKITCSRCGFQNKLAIECGKPSLASG